MIATPLEKGMSNLHPLLEEVHLSSPAQFVHSMSLKQLVREPLSQLKAHC
uniref:Uncharacterized protein n=1 Tax=Setaria italica TaxID=4555 RepID=K3YKS7_SETIT